MAELKKFPYLRAGHFRKNTLNVCREVIEDGFSMRFKHQQLLIGAVLLK